jgi:hypothetical protein
MAPTTFRNPLRAASPNGVAPPMASATASAATSLAVKFSGGRLIVVSSA